MWSCACTLSPAGECPAAHQQHTPDICCISLEPGCSQVTLFCCLLLGRTGREEVHGGPRHLFEIPCGGERLCEAPNALYNLIKAFCKQQPGCRELVEHSHPKKEWGKIKGKKKVRLQKALGDYL